jgi:tRNA A37 threonylcarbamoyladenosine modification protein TsaB
MHSIILQTVIKPHFVFEIMDGESELNPVDSFAGAFDILKEKSFTSETRLFVNRGPGSYAGIRAGLAYTLGLLHGKLLQKDQVFYYTSFDLIFSEFSDTSQRFLKAWPRTGGTKETIKGYYFDGLDYESIAYKELSSLETDIPVFTEYDEELDIPNQVIYIPSLITDIYLEDFAMTVALNTDGKPLYINPVNITTPKK